MKYLVVLATLFLAACDGNIPPPPEIWQCQYNGEPRAFFCVNTKTKEQIKVEAQHESMKAAQCLSAEDFKAGEKYIADLKKSARERCK